MVEYGGDRRFVVYALAKLAIFPLRGALSGQIIGEIRPSAAKNADLGTLFLVVGE